jgi:Family of unknown function (DUF6279)
MRIPYRLLQIIGCLALLLAVQACSAIRLAYNQAPDFIYWWMDGYVDFNEAQSPKVREEIAKLFAWHRANELPKLAALLQKTQTQAPGSVTNAQACTLFDEARVLFDNITERALPPMAEFVLTLTPEQLEHLQTKYKKSNEEYQRDFMFGSAAEKAASRLKRAVERSERFYGSLDEAQLTAVKRSIEISSFDAQRSFAERIRRQGDALQMLRKLIADKATPVQAQAALRAYIQRSVQSPDARYREYANKLVQEGCQSFADVHNSTTKEQRVKMVETLKGYEGDVRVLAVNK